MTNEQKIDLYKQVQQLNTDKELIEDDGVYTLGILETQDVNDDILFISS